MVVWIDTPSGPISGAAVTDVQIRLVSDFFKGDIGGAKPGFHGEAVVVELPDGRLLFALLDGATGWVVNELYDQGVDGGVPELSRAFKSMDAPLKLSPKYYPLMVTFGDLSDPASVMRVDPADLALSFGAGFGLREITLEVTDDAVTEGVVEGVFDYLNWPSERVLEYSCQVHKCDRSPLRLPNANGTTTILMPSDFISRNIK